ncbi:sodium-dependent proline transporter-like [Ptychodera flava]|uniref:sodium-dependent proline transporter-like n=1 Tax=Ptychodera flava TaxID=63121 RepID=UPI00396A4243
MSQYSIDEKPAVNDDQQGPPESSGKGGMSGEGAENVERGNWTGKLDFILSLIGYAVGLGNIWRFPALCYRNGGGAFLVPYLIMMFLCGMTLFFMEVAWGQFCSEGPITAWKLCPLFRGAGYAMVVISFLVSVYYNVIISYTLFYFFASFTKELPWKTCGNDWNTENCMVLDAKGNATFNVSSEDVVSPSQEYWDRYVLDLSSGLDNLGNVRWHLALCLLLAWLVVFLCLMKGVKSSGKVVYFTATFPYVVLTILIIRGVTLPGSAEGLKFFLIPKFHLLADAKVWGDAAVQIFYSLGPAWGGLLTFASFNRFHHNCWRDSIIVPLVNSGTSIYGGLAIFSVLGYMAHSIGKPVDEVVTSGPGLAFVVYPEALARIPGGPFWSIIFFFMLFTLGLDSQFGMVEGISSAIIDSFPKYLLARRTYFIAGLCILMYLLGLPIVTQGGMYLLTVMDWYSGSISLLVVSFCECLVIAWIYGTDRFYEDLRMMLGDYPNPWWKICWKFLTPLVIIFIIIMMYIEYVPVSYGSYVYPAAGEVIGWLCAGASLVMIPLWMVIEYIVNSKGNTFLERIQFLMTPSDDWGPALAVYRTGRYADKNAPQTTDINGTMELVNPTKVPTVAAAVPQTDINGTEELVKPTKVPTVAAAVPNGMAPQGYINQAMTQEHPKYIEYATNL